MSESGVEDRGNSVSFYCIDRYIDRYQFINAVALSTESFG